MNTAICNFRYSIHRIFCIGALALFSAAPVFADEATCGSLNNGVGPFDYRNPDPTALSIVNRVHFTPEVERLKEGATGAIGADIDFTLRVFPNYHRALASMMNLQFKLKTERPPGTRWVVSCYFDRAIRFIPDDGRVREIYGVYLLKLGKKAEAIEQLELAVTMSGEEANICYNLGLAYFETGDYEKSAAYAKKAYDRGFELPGLRNKLTKVGKWPPEN
jgi:hypothetical protein